MGRPTPATRVQDLIFEYKAKKEAILKELQTNSIHDYKLERLSEELVKSAQTPDLALLSKKALKNVSRFIHFYNLLLK
jgi:gamma-glutamyl-gamma-aminobutyrate hydrolase PuuD